MDCFLYFCQCVTKMQTGDSTLERDKPILHVHLHKCGGSAMCSLARLNGESPTPETITTGRNCNMAYYTDFPQTCQPTSGPAEIRQRVREQGITFLEIERDIRHGELKGFKDEGFTMGITFRDPRKYWISRFVFEQCNAEEVLELGVPACSPGNCIATFPGACGACAFQSFYTRSLSGNFATEKTSRRDLCKAMKSLEIFDTVLILENMDFTALKDVYHWTGTMNHGNAVPESSEDALLWQLQQFKEGQDQSDWDKLMADNEHDFELYECAKKIASGATSCDCKEFD